MPRRSAHPFDALANRFAEVIADRLANLLPRGNGGSARGRGPSRLRGRKLDMRCRYPGCKNRSKGPRFRFLCDDHLKLSKSEQNAALQKWAEKNG
jgi:hypothetical protein